MLLPQKTKFRKQHKGRIHGKAYKGFKLNFGSYGLKAITPGITTDGGTHTPIPVEGSSILTQG